MLKKTVTYEDYNGVTCTEDFYFNFTTAELMEKQLTTPGGYHEMLKRIIDANDVPSLTAALKDVILSSYGEKSADGKRFVKSPEISAAFSQTEAYSIIFEELFSDAGAAADFANAVFPAKLAEKMASQASAQLHLA